MITLINLKKINNIIEADYYYENDIDKLGHIKYDISTGKYLDIQRAEKEYFKRNGFEVGFFHIEKDLKRLIRHNIFPEKRIIMWY